MILVIVVLSENSSGRSGHGSDGTRYDPEMLVLVATLEVMAVRNGLVLRSKYS